MTDRRTGLRFEIVGRLRGTVAAEEALRLRNVSVGGALVETPWPLSVDSIHRVRLESERHHTMLQARVRHVRASEDSDRYVVGFEFVAIDPRAAEQLEHLVSRQLSMERHVERA